MGKALGALGKTDGKFCSDVVCAFLEIPLIPNPPPTRDALAGSAPSPKQIALECVVVCSILSRPFSPSSGRHSGTQRHFGKSFDVLFCMRQALGKLGAIVFWERYLQKRELSHNSCLWLSLSASLPSHLLTSQLVVSESQMHKTLKADLE